MMGALKICFDGRKEHPRTVATAAKVFCESADKQSAGYRNEIGVREAGAQENPT